MMGPSAPAHGFPNRYPESDGDQRHYENDDKDSHARFVRAPEYGGITVRLTHETAGARWIRGPRSFRGRRVYLARGFPDE